MLFNGHSQDKKLIRFFLLINNIQNVTNKIHNSVAEPGPVVGGTAPELNGSYHLVVKQ